MMMFLKKWGNGFKKLGSSFIGGVVGIVSFPFAISYHAARPFYDVASDTTRTRPQRFSFGCMMVFLGVIGFIGGFCIGALGGGLIGGGLGAYYGYRDGLTAGCTSLFGKKLQSFFDWAFNGNSSSHQANMSTVPSAFTPQRVNSASALTSQQRKNNPGSPRSHRDQPANVPTGSSLQFPPAPSASTIPLQPLHLTSSPIQARR